MNQGNQYAALIDQQQSTFIPNATNSQPFVQQQLRPSFGEKYKNVCKKLGISQIFLGSMSMVLGVINVILALVYINNGGTGLFGAGIWCGGLILTCGILGKKSSTKPGYCITVASMVVSIVSCLACAQMLIIEIIGASDWVECYRWTWTECPQIRSVLLIFNVMLILIGLSSLIIAIVHSAYCCKSVCCGFEPQQIHHHIYHAAPGPNQQQAVQSGVQYQYTMVPQVQPTMQGTETATETPPAYVQCEKE